jgi:LacI family transcriptional regulator
MAGGPPLIGALAPAGPADAMALTAHDGEFLAAFEREVRRHRHRLVLTGVARPADIPGLTEGLAGAVLLGFRDDELDALPRSLSRIVAIDSYLRHPSLAVVRTDDADGGRQAASALLAHGHREVVVAGPSDETSGVVRERHAGFRTAMLGAGAPAPRRHVTLGTSIREGVALGRSMRSRHPEATAVFATADALAIGIAEGLVLEGARVPADMSVMGFDNLELSAVVTPRLSTVAQDIPRKAHLAADALLGLGARNGVAEPLTVGVVVLERASIGRPAAR